MGSAEGPASEGQGEVPGEQQTEAMEVCEGQPRSDSLSGGTEGASPPTTAGEKAANGRKGSLDDVRWAHVYCRKESCVSAWLYV